MDKNYIEVPTKKELLIEKDGAFTAMVLWALLFATPVLMLFGINILGLLLFLPPVGLVVSANDYYDAHKKLKNGDYYDRDE